MRKIIFSLALIAFAFTMLSCAAASADTVDELNAEFNQSFRNGYYDEALEKAQKALEVAQATYGEEDAKVAECLEKIAIVKDAQGKRVEAEAFYKKAITICENKYGSDDPRCAAMVHKLGKLYFAQGKYEEAEANYVKALDVYRKSRGIDAFTMAGLTKNIADMYYTQGKFSEAEEYYKESLEHYGRAKGSEQQICDSLDKLYQIYFVKKDLKSAEEMCNKGLKICMAAEDKKSLYYSGVLARLGEIYAIQGQYGKAISRYKEALDIHKKIVGNDHPRVIGLMEKLSETYKAAGKQSQAKAIDKQIAAIISAR